MVSIGSCVVFFSFFFDGAAGVGDSGVGAGVGLGLSDGFVAGFFVGSFVVLTGEIVAGIESPDLGDFFFLLATSVQPSRLFVLDWP